MPETVTVAALLRLIADRVAGLERTAWIGVDGLGASGKSTLARAIAAATSGGVVSIDEFARPGLRGWDQDRFVADVVEPLLAGHRAQYETWDLLAGAPNGSAEVPSGVPVVVEGVSSTDVRLPVPWDVTVWVDAPAEVRWRRILDRDPPELLPVWREDWLPSERAYAEAQRPWQRVDYVVVGT